MQNYLNSSQVEELVSNNVYKSASPPYLARCFSSDYSNNPNLPALSLPGGDIGELAILISASNTYGFKLDIIKARDILFKLVSGKGYTSFHALKEHTLELCIYCKTIIEHSKEYGFDDRGKNELITAGKTLGLQNNFKLSQREDRENACIILEAEYGLFPNYNFDSGDRILNAKVLVFQKTFIDRRHRELCKLLFEKKAVELFSGLDVDYLYEIISEMTETHLFETMKLHDPKIPLYFASVSVDKKVTITSY